LKSKVGCFLSKSPQVVLGTSRRLEVDLGSLLYQVGSDWHSKVTPRSSPQTDNYAKRNRLIPQLFKRLFLQLGNNEG